MVFLGYPIWWGIAPRIIQTFLESYDFTGKTVIPFCTSGGSEISGSYAELKSSAPQAKWVEGRRFYVSDSQSTIDNWVKMVMPSSMIADIESESPYVQIQYYTLAGMPAVATTKGILVAKNGGTVRKIINR